MLLPKLQTSLIAQILFPTSLGAIVKLTFTKVVMDLLKDKQLLLHNLNSPPLLQYQVLKPHATLLNHAVLVLKPTKKQERTRLREDMSHSAEIFVSKNSQAGRLLEAVPTVRTSTVKDSNNALSIMKITFYLKQDLIAPLLASALMMMEVDKVDHVPESH
jgi:hypothetical protein